MLCGHVKYKEETKHRGKRSCPVSNILELADLKHIDLLINPYVPLISKPLNTAMPFLTQHLTVGICYHTRIKALWFVCPVFRLLLSLEKPVTKFTYTRDLKIYLW